MTPVMMPDVAVRSVMERVVRQRGTPIDVAIPNPTRALVGGVIRHDQVAAQGASKLRNLLGIKSDASTVRCRQSLHTFTPG